MAKLPNQIAITEVHVAEIRAQFMGPTPGVLTRMVYTNDQGDTFGETRMTMISARAREILDELRDVMAEDFTKLVMTPREQEEEEEEVEEPTPPRRTERPPPADEDDEPLSWG